MIKTYSVRRYWTVSDTVEVEAENVDEANEIAFDMDLGIDPSYVDNSINNDPEMDVIEGTPTHF